MVGYIYPHCFHPFYVRMGVLRLILLVTDIRLVFEFLCKYRRPPLYRLAFQNNPLDERPEGCLFYGIGIGMGSHPEQTTSGLG